MKNKSAARHWMIVVTLILTLVTGCTRASQPRDEAPEIQLAISLDPDPPLFGRPCQVIVTVSGADGAPIEDARLTIRGDMTHAGMVPVTVAVSEGIGGTYTVPFDWTMAGDWILTVEAELPDGRVVRRSFEVGVRVPGG